MQHVLFYGWQVGYRKIASTKLFQLHFNLGLKEAHHKTHLLLDEQAFILPVETAHEANEVIQQFTAIGALCRLMGTDSLLSLDDSDYKQLMSLLSDNRAFAFLQNTIKEPHYKKQFILSQLQQETLVEALGDVLMSKGIVHGEINEVGRIVESLIDKVSERFYE